MMKIDYPYGVDDLTKRFMEGVEEKIGDVLEPCDIANAWAMMVAFDNYVKASRDVLANGAVIYDKRGRGKTNPSVGVMEKYYNQLHAIMKEYGLTLKSRERIKSLTPEVDEDNPLMQFINEVREIHR